MKIKALRHGEICFEIIDKLPEGLKKSNSKEFLVGSHGHSHKYNNGELYLKTENEYIFGYFVAKNTTLTHLEHGDKKVGELKTAKLPDNIYRLRRAIEYINGDLRQVVD
jgi:hypothetical protein